MHHQGLALRKRSCIPLTAPAQKTLSEKQCEQHTSFEKDVGTLYTDILKHCDEIATTHQKTLHQVQQHLWLGVKLGKKKQRKTSKWRAFVAAVV
jgi:hypothetical protein